MRVVPISEQDAEAQSANLWPDGTYDFEIKEAEETTSNAGNEMFALEVWIFNDNGERKNIFDYLVNSDKAAWKIRHFAAACGMISQYEKGNLLAGEIVGRTGRCTLGTQPAKDNYPAKNVIRGYVKAISTNQAAARPAPQKQKAPAGDIDDDVPF